MIRLGSRLLLLALKPMLVPLYYAAPQKQVLGSRMVFKERPLLYRIKKRTLVLSTVLLAT